MSLLNNKYKQFDRIKQIKIKWKVLDQIREK